MTSDPSPQPHPGTPIKVALLTDSNVIAGTERHMLDLARGLKAAGAVPSIACPSDSPLVAQARAEDIEHIPVEKGGTIDRPAITTLRERLRSGKTDLIHAHNGRSALSAALAVKLERRGAYVLTQHFLVPSRAGRTGLKGLLSNGIHRWLSRTAGHIIAISQATIEGIDKRRECGNNNISMIPNGIAIPDLAQIADPEGIRASFGVAPGQPLVVSVARLEEEKDLRSLVAAMPAVLAAVPDAVCVIAGEGTQLKALTAQIDALGIGHSVHLAGFRTDALSIMNAADVFVLPSLAEPFGLVLIEAMSLGKPVISTRAGGPLEIVEDGITGLLVPPSDPAALGGAITRLLKDHTLRLSMSARGKSRFAQCYTLDRMTTSILGAYRSALNASGRSAGIYVPPGDTAHLGSSTRIPSETLEGCR